MNVKVKSDHCWSCGTRLDQRSQSTWMQIKRVLHLPKLQSASLRIFERQKGEKEKPYRRAHQAGPR